jgi:hypothetical protein
MNKHPAGAPAPVIYYVQPSPPVTPADRAAHRPDQQSRYDRWRKRQDAIRRRDRTVRRVLLMIAIVVGVDLLAARSWSAAPSTGPLPMLAKVPGPASRPPCFRPADGRASPPTSCPDWRQCRGRVVSEPTLDKQVETLFAIGGPYGDDTTRAAAQGCARLPTALRREARSPPTYAPSSARH